jgi:hypothetical protein
MPHRTSLLQAIGALFTRGIAYPRAVMVFHGTLNVQFIGDETHHGSPKPQLRPAINVSTPSMALSIIPSNLPRPIVICVESPLVLILNTSLVSSSYLSGIWSPSVS